MSTWVEDEENPRAIGSGVGLQGKDASYSNMGEEMQYFDICTPTILKSISNMVGAYNFYNNCRLKNLITSQVVEGTSFL